MPLTFESAKTWVTENPLMAAGAGLLAVGAITLAVSSKARKAVGLAGVNRTHSKPQRALPAKRSKRSRKAKSVNLR